MQRVLFSKVCFVVALSVGLSSAVPAFAVPPQGIPSTDGLVGAGPNPKAVMMYNLGITAYKQGSTEAAIIFFKRACDIDPNLADAQYNLAVIFQAQKRYKEAIPRFEEVLRIKPSDADAHYQVGVLLQDQGRANDARQHLSAIAPNSPHFPDAQRRLAQLSSAASQPAAQQYAPPQTYQQPTGSPYPPQTSFTPPTQYVQQTVTAQTLPTGVQPNGLPDVSALAPPLSPLGQPTIPDNVAYQTPTTAAPYAQPVPVVQPPQSVNPFLPVQTAPVQQQPEQSIAQPQPAMAPTPSSSSVSPNPIPVMANSSLRVVATGFRAPSGLTFDRGGYLYVANYTTSTIDRIAPDGTRSQFSSGKNLKGPIGLVADDLGNVYVANYDGGTVAKINPAGVISIVATGFKKPYYVTLDRDGNLYVSQQEDNSIVRITLPRPTAASRP